jgi:hypothetical protein
MISGNCQWEDEVARLLRASNNWRSNLRTGHLSVSDAWYALNRIINRAVEYSIMATYLSKADCEKIMRPFLNAGLSASGVVRTMPRAVVWGPMRYQGLGICHLYTTQGVEHLLAILRHATHPTLSGQLLRTTIEEMQLEIGLPRSFLFTHKLSTDLLPLDHGLWRRGSFCPTLGSLCSILSQSLNLRLRQIVFSRKGFSPTATEASSYETWTTVAYICTHSEYPTCAQVMADDSRLKQRKFTSTGPANPPSRGHGLTDPSSQSVPSRRSALTKHFLRSTDFQVLVYPLG